MEWEAVTTEKAKTSFKNKFNAGSFVVSKTILARIEDDSRPKKSLNGVTLSKTTTASKALRQSTYKASKRARGSQQYDLKPWSFPRVLQKMQVAN